MPELETQLRRYTQDLVDGVEPVTADEVRGWQRPAPRLVGSRRPLAAGAALVVMLVVVGAVGWLVRADRAEQVLTGPAAVLQATTDWGLPAQLASHEDAMWLGFAAASEDDGLPEGPGGVVRVDPATLDAEVVAEVDSLSALAAVDMPRPDQSSRVELWATGFSTDVVTRLDAATGEVLAEVALPAAAGFGDGRFLPNGIAATPEAVWVTSGRGKVALVDPARNAVVAVIDVAAQLSADAVAHGPGAWVNEAEDRLARLDRHTRRRVAMPVDVGGGAFLPRALALQDDRLWVAGAVQAGGQPGPQDRGALVALERDDATAAPVTELSTPEPLREVAASRDAVWAAGRDSLWRTDARQPQGPERLAAAPAAHPRGLWHAADALWMLDPRDDALIELDPSTGHERRRLRFRTPDLNRPLVLDHRGRSPLHADELADGMTPGVVEGERLRVFATRPNGEDQALAFVADAQHLDGEGLWWCPDEKVFLAPTHGELFDPGGQLVAGPARADLDRLPLQTTDDGLLVADTDQREPGTPRDTGLGLKADLNPSVYDRYRHDWRTPGTRPFCADHQPPVQRPDTNL